ncbi:MAG: hypothetical protein ABIQ41_11235 [Gemmatimonadales bacterium]
MAVGVRELIRQMDARHPAGAPMTVTPDQRRDMTDMHRSVEGFLGTLETTVQAALPCGNATRTGNRDAVCSEYHHLEDLNMSPVSAVAEPHTNRLSVVVVGQATSLFLVISFLFCVLLALVTSNLGFEHWFTILPGVSPLTWTSALLDVVETMIYGWYIALAFVPLYNWAAMRRASR